MQKFRAMVAKVSVDLRGHHQKQQRTQKVFETA